MLNKYQPLFLKYRPQAISELVGQSQVATTLTNAIKYDRISHAYLFTGPRGTGKTSSARIFAKSLNCEQGPTATPCQKCTACLEIKQGISPSVFEIDAASNNSVDDARLLIERAPLSACGGRFKLYIIDECHMLTKEAFNALLKTIEEPPANVIFVLATTEENKVPPTIVSRCQKLIFRLIDEQAMITHLAHVAACENIIVETEAMKAIARRSGGGLRDALSLLDQVSLLGMDGQTVSTQDVLLLTGALPEDILIAMSRHIIQKEGKETLLLLQELLNEGREAHIVTAELAKHMLNIAKAAHISQDKSAKKTDRYSQALLELSQLVNAGELIQMIEELDRLEISCRRSAQPVMNLEIGLLSLCHRLDITELQSIHSRLEKLENGQKSDIISPERAPAKPEKTKEAARIEPAPIFKTQEDVKPLPEKQPLPKPPVISNDSDLSEETIPSEAAVKIEEPMPEKPAAVSDSTDNSEVDIIWQNLLAELQRKHLPTYSLLSTHGFPVGTNDNILTIGVLVEHFQKMLESKIEHIKNALVICQPGDNLTVRIKLVAGGEQNRPKEKQSGANTADPGIASGSSNDNADELNQGNKSRTQSSAAHHLIRSDNKNEFPVIKDIVSPSPDRYDQTAVKEAYRLFEGPGSRFIAPTN